MLAKILLRRGIISADQALAHLCPEHYKPANPHELPDVDKALNRINQALANNEQITIYGDYDVDGITGTSLLLTALRQLRAKVGYYIPNRATEGYGLNLKAVSILASKHQTKLLITCDCGVANFAEINFAKSLGVDTIILDHHALPELLPPAQAIVHPKFLPSEHPLFHLPGVGVAYKVIEALFSKHGLDSLTETFLDYVTLGMIADLVPLIRENRYLVQIGLPRLINSSRAGIQALLAQIQQSGDTDLVGFGLAPRINAVGRLADAKTAVELLTTDDKKIASKLAAELQNENSKRQQICDRVLLEAEQTIAANGIIGKKKAIVIYKEGWHHGVVGIVASRLVDKYHLPVFIGELDTQEGVVKGSARGIESLDLCEILKANQSLLNKWGGHKMAAGFSLPAEKAEAFRAAVDATCNRLMSGSFVAPILNIDVSMEDMAIDFFAVAEELNKLSPFGMENKKPLFYAHEMQCEKATPLGRENKHQRLDLLDKKTKAKFSCVFWNAHNIVPGNDSLIDIVFTPEINTFNGRQRLQLVLADWQMSNGNHPPNQMDASPETALSPASLDIGNQPAQIAAEVQVSQVHKTPIISASAEQVLSESTVWHDLRPRENETDLVEKALAKLGNNLAVFCEKTGVSYSYPVFDRISIPAKEHLLVLQFPPSPEIWSEIINKSGANKIYVIGKQENSPVDAPAFIKRLLGLIRYVVNKKSGSVEARRIAAALGTTDVASALGLALLRQLHFIDWYADEGMIYLDLLNNPDEQDIKHLTEYYQLDGVLKEISAYRLWCTKASLKDLQERVRKANGADKEKIDPLMEITAQPESNDIVSKMSNLTDQYMSDAQIVSTGLGQ